MKLKTIKGQPSWNLQSDKVSLWLTRLGGHLGPVEFRLGSRTIAPYSIAPWAEEILPASTPPILRVLRGDFFCMPFGDNLQPWKKEKYPPHGETANKRWSVKRMTSNPEFSEGEWTLRSTVRKGRVRKLIRLYKGESVIYSRHVLEGMSGPMSFGHHPMLKFPTGEGTGIISSSSFLFGQVVPQVFENPASGGYTNFKRGAVFHSLRKIPLDDGTHADLTRYPVCEGFENAVLLAMSPNKDFSWLTVTFPKERFVWFVLSDPKVLTTTLLWLSNGGRHYAPWNGRHRGVLGIEQVTSYFNQGIAASINPNPLSRRGIKTALRLDPQKPLLINHIMGVAPIPENFGAVSGVTRTSAGILLRSRSGKKVTARVQMDFLGEK